jgi:hypothetical protein
MGDYPTRFNVACLDPDKCWARSCMRAGEDKGSFTVGRGYTSYHKKPKPVCVTRDYHGCPSPLPEPDPENARCCYRPHYYNARRDRKAVPCDTCGATASGKAAKVLNTLPTLPGVPCRHEKQDDEPLVAGWRKCLACRGYWADRTRVQPFEVPTHTFEQVLDEMSRRLRETPS